LDVMHILRVNCA